MKKDNDMVITVLRGPDRVRKRPCVMFGSDGADGCLEAVSYIVDNAGVEAALGYGDVIKVTRYEDDSYEITDRGRGIPVEEYNADEKKYFWELNFCELFADSMYNNSTGEKGIGLCGVQYASEYMDACIFRARKKYTLHFEKGVNIGGLKAEEADGTMQGTSLKFKLDREVFADISVTHDMLGNMLRCYAISNFGIRYELEYKDHCETVKTVYCYKNLSDRFRELDKNSDIPLYEFTCPFSGVKNGRGYSGNVRICIGFTKHGKFAEIYHHSSYKTKCRIAFQELETIVAVQIKAFLKELGYPINDSNTAAVADSIGIIVRTEISPGIFSRYDTALKAEIINRDFSDAVRNASEPFVRKMLEENVCLIGSILEKGVSAKNNNV